MNYKRIEIDLSQQRTDTEIELNGSFKNFIIVKNDADFSYKLNSTTADALYSNELQGFQGDGVFRSVYITNEVSNGIAVLVVF